MEDSRGAGSALASLAHSSMISTLTAGSSRTRRAVVAVRLLLPPKRKSADDRLSGCCWILADDRSLYIEEDPRRAGGALIMVFVDDLDGLISEIGSRALEPAEHEKHSNGVRKATYRDDDGNEIGSRARAREGLILGPAEQERDLIRPNGSRTVIPRKRKSRLWGDSL